MPERNFEARNLGDSAYSPAIECSFPGFEEFLSMYGKRMCRTRGQTRGDVRHWGQHSTDRCPTQSKPAQVVSEICMFSSGRRSCTLYMSVIEGSFKGFPDTAHAKIRDRKFGVSIRERSAMVLNAPRTSENKVGHGSPEPSRKSSMSVSMLASGRAARRRSGNDGM